jgi:hypothetical protein
MKKTEIAERLIPVYDTGYVNEKSEVIIDLRKEIVEQKQIKDKFQLRNTKDIKQIKFALINSFSGIACRFYTQFL